MAIGIARHANPNPENYAHLAERIRPPYHVPPVKGGISLRLAMVQDTLHQRYPAHGIKWYEARIAATNIKLQALPSGSKESWPLIDDLAVAWDRVGQPDQGVSLLRQKLAEQQAAGLEDAELYTSYANLGTLLIHSNMPAATRGDTASVELVRQGLDMIRTSVRIKPDAHFGREVWQVRIVEFLLQTIEYPGLLRQHDFVGNGLDLSIEMMLDREQIWSVTRYGRTNFVEFTREYSPDEAIPEFVQPDFDFDAAENYAVLQPMRRYVTTIGDESSGLGESKIPFDAPILGIIGMWQEGGGPNAHFALAIGEIMLRVGQRYIAWNAFERASRLAARFSADPDTQEFLRQHCSQRQTQIEESLRFVAAPNSSRRSPAWQNISTPADPKVVDSLRHTFELELADGEKYQREYQAYEDSQIAAGRPIDDPNFFDEFHRDHGEIASPVGLEESILLVPRRARSKLESKDTFHTAILGAGVGAMCVALLQRMFWRFKRRKTLRPE